MRTLVLAVAFVAVATTASAEIYRWVDERGAVHLDDDLARVPEAHRESAKVFRARAAVPAAVEPVSGPTQQAFVEALARDLGLATSSTQYATSALQVVGIYPAGGWHPQAPLTSATVSEVVSAVRSAARARRLALDEAAAEAAALRVASALGVAGPPPAVVVAAAPPPPEPQPIIVAPHIVVESPPVSVSIVERSPQPVLSGYVPYFGGGVPFAPFFPRKIGPVPERITPLSSPAGRLRGPLVEPLRPRAGFTRPLTF